MRIEDKINFVNILHMQEAFAIADKQIFAAYTHARNLKMTAHLIFATNRQRKLFIESYQYH